MTVLAVFVEQKQHIGKSVYLLCEMEGQGSVSMSVPRFFPGLMRELLTMNLSKHISYLWLTQALYAFLENICICYHSHTNKYKNYFAILSATDVTEGKELQKHAELSSVCP